MINKPTYTVTTWQDKDWWLASVEAVSDGGDSAPIGRVTQGRTAAEIDEMAVDLIATMLDVPSDAFEIKFERAAR